MTESQIQAANLKAITKTIDALQASYVSNIYGNDVARRIDGLLTSARNIAALAAADIYDNEK